MQAFELAGLMKHGDVTNQNGHHIDVLFTLALGPHNITRLTAPFNTLGLVVLLLLNGSIAVL